MKKRNGLVIILVIFLVLFCYEGIGVYKNIHAEYTAPQIIEEIKEEYNNLSEEEKAEYTIDEYIEMTKSNALTFGIFGGIFITFFIMIIKYSFLFILLIAISGATKKYHRTKLSKDDFSNNEYYRDILKKYSVDLLGFIDHVQFNYPDVLIAMLLQLQMKGVLNLDNNGIYLNSNIDLNSLSNHERYLISKIVNNRLVMNNINEYELLVVNEGIEKELLEKKKIDGNYLFKEFSASIIFYLIILIGYICYWSLGFSGIVLGSGILNIIMTFLVALIWVLITIYILGYPIYLKIKFVLFRTKVEKNPYFRKKEAESINKKLEGLKDFLNDFSKLEERDAKELVLWNEFLIYSVLFGHNKKIINKYKDLIVICGYQQNC